MSTATDPFFSPVRASRSRPSADTSAASSSSAFDHSSFPSERRYTLDPVLPRVTPTDRDDVAVDDHVVHGASRFTDHRVAPVATSYAVNSTSGSLTEPQVLLADSSRLPDTANFGVSESKMATLRRHNRCPVTESYAAKPLASGRNNRRPATTGALCARQPDRVTGGQHRPPVPQLARVPPGDGVLVRVDARVARAVPVLRPAAVRHRPVARRCGVGSVRGRRQADGEYPGKQCPNHG